MEHDIGIWFLLLSLFVPRIVLFFWWMNGVLPWNDTPLWADVLCGIFFPRILILVYIYGCQGFSPWFWIHLVALFVAWAYNLANFSKNMEKAKEMANR